jgi:hypothetical protein
MGIELGLHRRDSLYKAVSDDVERSHAINLFWSIYVLDRRWSFGTGMPFALQDADIDPTLPEPVSYPTASYQFNTNFAGTEYPLPKRNDSLLPNRLQSLALRFIFHTLSSSQYRGNRVPRLPSPTLAKVHPRLSSTLRQPRRPNPLSRYPPSPNPSLPPCQPDAYPNLSSRPSLCFFHPGKPSICVHRRRAR